MSIAAYAFTCRVEAHLKHVNAYKKLSGFDRLETSPGSFYFNVMKSLAHFYQESTVNNEMVMGKKVN